MRLDDIRKDLLYFCGLVDTRASARPCPLNLHGLFEMHISIWSRLLDYRTLNKSLEAAVTEITIQHLGLALFVMTTFLGNDQKQIVDYRLLRECIIHAVDELCEYSYGIMNDALLIWFLLLAFTWSPSISSYGKFGITVRRTISCLGIETWEDVRTATPALPWLENVHQHPHLEPRNLLDHMSSCL